MLQRLLSDNFIPTADAGVGALAVSGLSVAYHQRLVLRDVTWTAPAQGLVAVVGPNGAGKSTFLKAVLGLVPSLTGTIEVYGRPLKRQRALIGYVPQRESVDWDFPVSALDVVTMGRYGLIGWGRRIGAKHKQAAMQALDRVGMADFAHRQIGQLSGGQQQRVFLARALAQEARLYFMDEPLAGVDAATEQTILAVLRELDAEGRTVICVHHDLQTVAETFDHVLMLSGGLVAAGPVREALTEENLRRAYGQRASGLLLGPR
ncbi:metal ABC transporter ATP-binding protein [Niveispirillum sp.]|uniref:metal ABC transporter ATP-binding protein n=1 Tax=Niveispirillum sp. TaxID=1917217 RepID=UPI001B574B81|nr:metal ABC transporter ATP-binding protein [Niveispirillum sp.]MBP7336750.1 metal ABC transporter ATP-binding protein [Niveispirillum sp.]